MAKIEGKTIDELLRVEDITGSEIIPMSVYSEELAAYVTRGITLDDLFKTIYARIQATDEAIAYTGEAMSAYVTELREVDEALHGEDVRLDRELQKTNAYVSYNAEAIVHIHDDVCRFGSYAYIGIGQNASDIAYNRRFIENSYAGLAYAIEYGDEQLASELNAAYSGLAYAIQAGDDALAYDLQVSYNKLDKAIAYVAAYAEAGSGEIAEELANLKSYTYSGIGHNSYVNMVQDLTLMQHQQAIGTLAEGLSYESYVNTIQSGHINTIYYENSTDAFNDWTDPDDDNVKPQV